MSFCCRFRVAPEEASASPLHLLWPRRAVSVQHQLHHHAHQAGQDVAAPHVPGRAGASTPWQTHNSTFFNVVYRVYILILGYFLQARSEKAVSQQDVSVGNLKACWDRLKHSAGNSFVRLVTSSFPSQKVKAVFSLYLRCSFV